MARVARKKSASGYYHVMIRGMGKQILFEEPEDYTRFRDTLKRFIETTQVEVHAYCMMKDHVHLLLRDPEDQIDMFMKKLETSYTSYFNRKYERTGPLFQDRFKSETVENDAHFAVVLRFILQNPKKGRVANMSEYLWSSYGELVNGSELIHNETALSLFSDMESLLKYIQEPSKDQCIEPTEPPLSDTSAKKIICKSLKVESGTQLQSLEKEERDAALRKLKQKGLSVRQIERLTGINRGVVLKA